MSRPLLITDCDEVLLHMVSHFADWLRDEQGLTFDLECASFADAVSDSATREPVPINRLRPLLGDFFETEMQRQTLVPGAAEALARIGEVADIVVLTNLPDLAHSWRVDQLAGHGIRHEVVCNSGGKGVPAREIRDRLGAGTTVFVDDLEVHHASVAKHAPEVWRLHMIAEPKRARVVPKAGDAHARIDDWPTACDWILARFEEQV